MSQDRVVICMKWGTLFPADYVNVLHNACRANISGPFRFVCLTDDSTGLSEGVESFPIPDIGLRPDEWYTRGIWPKLSLFVEDLYGLRGRCLFIDLDMMILGPLDAMFEFGTGVVTTDMGMGWRPGGQPGAVQEAGTCVFAFDLGKESHILKAFQADRESAKARFRNEQDFVGFHAKTIGFWPKGWVISFKRHLVRRYGRDLILPPPAPATGPAILAFHGDPRPADLLQTGIWGRFPHLGRGPVGWVVDYWTRNGGRLPIPREGE